MRFICFILLVTFVTSCTQSNPNLGTSGEDALKAHEMDRAIEANEQTFSDIIYVPIYSDIYLDQQNESTLLAATLSIRNTSFSDSLFISTIDYYNTEGALVRSYIENPISLGPMATINYVVDKDDDTGGPGANFIVELSAKTNIRPLIQAIMVGQSASNKAFSFAMDGYSIK